MAGIDNSAWPGSGSKWAAAAVLEEKEGVWREWMGRVTARWRP
jgi:hypothetical protein